MEIQKLSSRWRTAFLLFAGMVLLLASIACGSDDNDTPAQQAPPTQASATATAQAPVPTPKPVPTRVPPAAPMVPAAAPEPGSDEEQIMAVLEKRVRAVNTADYGAFQETCTPSVGDPPSIADLKRVYEERQGAAGWAGRFQPRFSPDGYNVRNVEVKLLRAPFAQAVMDVYDYENIAGFAVINTFENVGGQWYSESLPCGPGQTVK